VHKCWPLGAAEDERFAYRETLSWGSGAPRVLKTPFGAAEDKRRAVVGGVRHERERLRRERDSLGRAEHRRRVLCGRQREVEQLAVAQSAEQVLVRRLLTARKCLRSAYEVARKWLGSV